MNEYALKEQDRKPYELYLEISADILIPRGKLEESCPKN